VLLERAIAQAPNPAPPHLTERVLALHRLYIGEVHSPDAGDLSVGTIGWLGSEIGKLYVTKPVSAGAQVIDLMERRRKLH
jgi:hypothetical protein